MLSKIALPDFKIGCNTLPGHSCASKFILSGAREKRQEWLSSGSSAGI
jgi:hypothetical protein